MKSSFFIASCLLVLVFVPGTLSKFDFDLHLSDLADIYKTVSKNKNFTWANVTNLLKNGADAFLNSNVRGLRELRRKLGISFDCYENLYKMGIDLRNGKEWALRMIDATGKIPSGVLEGTIMDFGSYEECLDIDVRDTGRDPKQLFKGQYCMVGFRSALLSPMYLKAPDGRSYTEAYGIPPDWAYKILQRSGGYMKRIAFWFGICLPSTCSEDDILKLFSFVSSPLKFNVSVSDCHVEEKTQWPVYSLASVCVLGCLAGLCIIGTIVDSICRWRKNILTRNEDDHVLIRIPKAFSVLTNTELLFRGNSGSNLGCFHGMRFLSATWIILGHTYFYTDTWKYLKYRRLLGFEEMFNRNIPLAPIENFTIPVGSFFFMSGFLLVYTTWKQVQKNFGQVNPSCFASILKFFIHKYWRMTPALGFTLVLFFAMPIIDAGPLWYSTLNPPIQQCRNLWWTNMLYINNWWNVDQYCLIHTWYLAALMQFHMIGIILIIFAYRWPIFGVFLGSSATIACFFVTAYMVVKYNYPLPAPGLVKDMDVIDDYNSHIYIKPFAHFISYLIGMVAAYLLLKYPDIKLPPKYQVTGWILAIAGALATVYGLYGPAPHISVIALYVVGHRISWALSMAWLTFACATGVGGIVNRLLSWNAMSSLGQLSYLAYLLHPLVIIYRNAALRERVYYGQTELVFSFFSNLMISFLLAYVGYVTVEIPFAILEKMVFSYRSKVDFKHIECKDSKVETRRISVISP